MNQYMPINPAITTKAAQRFTNLSLTISKLDISNKNGRPMRVAQIERNEFVYKLMENVAAYNNLKNIPSDKNYISKVIDDPSVVETMNALMSFKSENRTTFKGQTLSSFIARFYAKHAKIAELQSVLADALYKAVNIQLTNSHMVNEPKNW